jgi:hypothetical protein
MAQSAPDLQEGILIILHEETRNLGNRYPDFQAFLQNNLWSFRYDKNWRSGQPDKNVQR